MPFQKGHKFGGSKTLGPNINQMKQKLQIRDFLEKFVKKYQKDMLRTDLNACTPRERTHFMGNMLPFLIPHLSATDLTTNGESVNTAPPNIVFNFTVKEKVKLEAPGSNAVKP